MLQPGTELSHYRLIEKIGEGGMGVVWKALDTTLDREVAIKLLPREVSADAERLARFEREAKLLASLSHPNIAAIHGLHEADDLRFLTMELVTGETLAARLGRGAVPLDACLSIAGQILEALQAAHDRGVIHRDLKPANIQITPEGQVKVLDFGLAKALEPAGDESTGDATRSPTLTYRSTGIGTILGTAAYMSPEQARGDPADKRSDLWSFGVVLWELLSGRRLFLEPTVSDTLAAVLRKEPEWERLPAATPRPLRRLLRRCLARPSGERLRDAADALLEIRDAADRPADEPASPSAGRRPILPWALSAVSLVVALALGGAIVSREEPESRAVVFSLAPPEGWDFALSAGPARLSPDGTYLVAPLRGAEEVPRLAVRRLDEDRYRFLSTTIGADDPFWAPDSRFIGYFDWPRRKLAKVGVDGGAALALADAPEYQGATWNEAGVILFAPDAGPILRVSAAGGTPQPLTRLDAERAEAGHAWPHFLPDGKRFLYLAFRARDSRGENPRRDMSLWVGSLDGDPPRSIPGSFESAVSYAPPGVLLHLKDGTLVARRFDARRLAWRGEAEIVAQDVLARGPGSNPAFSVSDDGTLVYHVQEEFRAWKLVRRHVDGRVLSELPLPFWGRNLDPSPDGRRVALERRGEEDTRDIWIVDLERGTQQRFTFDPADEYGPVWSADGRRLAYVREDSSTYRVISKATIGPEDETLVLESEDPLEVVDWSPDGDWLLLERGGEAEDLWLLPAAGGGEPRPFVATPFDENTARFSPDGRWVSYNSDETGRREVYVRPSDGQGAAWLVSTAGGFNARWSADGSEIYYMTERGGVLMAAPVRVGPDGFRSGIPRVLFGAAGFRPEYEPTPDDGVFLITEPLEVEALPLTVVLDWPALLEDRD